MTLRKNVCFISVTGAGIPFSFSCTLGNRVAVQVWLSGSSNGAQPSGRLWRDPSIFRGRRRPAPTESSRRGPRARRPSLGSW